VEEFLNPSTNTTGPGRPVMAPHHHAVMQQLQSSHVGRLHVQEDWAAEYESEKQQITQDPLRAAELEHFEAAFENQSRDNGNVRWFEITSLKSKRLD
jgi:hypothetical protein